MDGRWQKLKNGTDKFVGVLFSSPMALLIIISSVAYYTSNSAADDLYDRLRSNDFAHVEVRLQSIEDRMGRIEDRMGQMETTLTSIQGDIRNLLSELVVSLNDRGD